MEQRNLNLAALIGSRICHDLISPIGAINNGLELLGMTGPADGPEMALISESVENAGARIRFFRVAYGAAGEQMMGPSEVGSILNDLSKGGRLDIRWDIEDPQPRAEVRLVFLGLQCLETAMPYGGKIDICLQDGNWTLAGAAGKLIIDQELWDIVTGREPDPNVSPAQVQFALLPLLAQDVARTISAQISDTELKLRF